MKYFCLICLLFLFSCSQKQQYHYQSLSDNLKNRQSLTIDFQRMELNRFDLSTSFKECANDEPLYCLISSSYVFAFPKGDINYGDSWSKAGADFNVISNEFSILIAGSSFKVFIIESQQSGKKVTILYSKKSGMVAIQYGPETSKKWAIIEGEEGYGKQ